GQLMNCEGAPDGGIDLAQRYFAAKASSQQITYLAFEKVPEGVRANVNHSRNNYDRSKKSEHQEYSLEISNEKTHRLEVLPDTEIKLPTAVSSSSNRVQKPHPGGEKGKRLERWAQV